MSKLLRQLLAAKEPLFTQSLRELEYITGKQNIDNKLAAEIMQRTHAVIRELGLDPGDTTDKELYHALNDKVAQHSELLADQLGVSSGAKLSEVQSRLIAVVEETSSSRSCWVLKKSVAKKLLREMPPKAMMKHLGYRSIESMFKNENFAEIYCGLRFSEGENWLNEFNALFAKSIRTSDFEQRDIEAVGMDYEKWIGLTDRFTHRKHHNIVHAKELGVIAILPTDQGHEESLVLNSLPLMYHYINEIRLYSTFFKHKSTFSNFGEIITDTLTADIGTGATVSNFHIHWRVVQRYFGELQGGEPPEAFQPHIQPEDLSWRSAAQALYELNPALRFWEDLDYVGRLTEQMLPVSFNLLDVSLSHSNKMPFESRYFYHMRESLWNEIFTRYIGQPRLQQQILEQLDSGMIRPEEI